MYIYIYYTCTYIFVDDPSLPLSSLSPTLQHTHTHTHTHTTRQSTAGESNQRGAQGESCHLRTDFGHAQISLGYMCVCVCVDMCVCGYVCVGKCRCLGRCRWMGDGVELEEGGGVVEGSGSAGLWYMYVYTNVHAYMHAQTHMQHTYTHKCTQTYIHIRTHSSTLAVR